MAKGRISKRHRPTVRGYRPPDPLSPRDDETPPETPAAPAEDPFESERTLIDPRRAMDIGRVSDPGRPPARGARSGDTLPPPSFGVGVPVPELPGVAIPEVYVPPAAGDMPGTRPGLTDDDEGPTERQKAHQPEIEVVFVREAGTPQTLGGPWRMYEVWTQNNVYNLDASLVCVEVIDRKTGRPAASSKILGSRMMGGKIRHDPADPDSGMEISHPLPRPGSNAVFELALGKRVSFSETSPVTRIVVRLRVVDIAAGVADPGWEEITGPHRTRRK
jgi:hypothetical protein